MHVMGDSFVNLVEYKAGYERVNKKMSIPTLLWQFGASESGTLSMFCY